MRVYISGPITGKENLNRGAFAFAAATIRSEGHTPINPHDLPHNHGKTWGEFMIEDLEALRNCEAIFMLDGWVDSKGAKIEHDFALGLGIPILV